MRVDGIWSSDGTVRDQLPHHDGGTMDWHLGGKEILRMTDLWVAVTAEYGGSTFSHRAESYYSVEDDQGVLVYNLLLEDAGDRVRRGLAGALPPQKTISQRLSEHEKLAEIEAAIEGVVVTNDDSAASNALLRIAEVLDR
jgi:hypothetical protein